MKDRTCGVPIKCFVGLKSKIYFFKIKDKKIKTCN